MNGRQHPEAERACACPSTDGVIRHQRETCTDPVVARLGWYADTQPPAEADDFGPFFHTVSAGYALPASAFGKEPCGECGGGYAQEHVGPPASRQPIPHAQECPQVTVTASLPPLEALEALTAHGYGYPSARGLLHLADREGFAVDGDVTVRPDEEHQGCFIIARQQQPEPEAGA
jgi:hypothetical protein